MPGWSIKSGISPVSISNDSITALNGKIHTVGGMNASALSTKITQIYNITSDTWDQGGNLVTARQDAALAKQSGKIYVVGGRNIWGYNPSQLIEPLSTIEALDVATGVWSQLNGTIQPGRWNLSACYYHEYLYAIGGYRAEGAYDKTYVNYIEAIHVITGARSIVANLKQSRFGHASVEIDGKIYILGGYNDSSDELYSMEIFDIAEQKVTDGPSAPLGGRVLADVYRGKLYLSARYGDGAVYVYDPPAGTWAYVSQAPSGYRSFAGIAIDGHLLFADTGRTKPLITFDLRSSTLTNLSPTAGFINEKEDQKFSWFFDSPVKQTSATFQWRATGTSTVYSIHVPGSQQYVIVPANTFPNGSIDWRVSATGEDGVDADRTTWYTLTTIDEPPTKPTGLYPSSGMRDGTKPIQLSWIHNSPLSTPQSAYEVEVTYDGVTWQAISGKVTTSETLYTVPADSLGPDTTGRVGWRVRTYNSDDAASPWSDAAYFIVLFAPDAPEWRSVESGKSRPLCEWVAPGQIAYQMQITQGESVVYDTGETYGPATQHRVTEYLKNGTYIFRLRYKNQLNIWSDYADRSVSINSRGRLKLSLNGEKIPNGAKLTFTVEVV